MPHLLIALASIALGGLMLWGWGWALRQCTGCQPLTFPLTMALGVATILFVGGILNLVKFAIPLAFDVIVLAGVAFAIVGWGKAKWPLPAPSRGMIGAMLPLLFAAVCLAAWFTPQNVFNHHDDFEKYFVYPVKMLATGTLPPNPLGSLGADTLGGQAFLQGFAVAHFPLPFVGALDSVFCLLLCLTLVGFAIKPDAWAVRAVAAELLVAAIDPQIVNISSVYSGAALMMTAVFLTGLERNDRQQEIPVNPVLLGLVYAGLLSLKTILGVFVGFHLLIVTALGMARGERRLRWMTEVGVSTFIFLLPWIALHLSLYLEPVPHMTTVRAPDWSKTFDFFSVDRLFYGATALHYTSLALVGLVIAVWGFAMTRQKSLRFSASLGAAAAGGLTTFVVFVVLVAGLGPLLFGNQPEIRYACPVFIGVIPASLRLLGSVEDHRWSRRFLWGMIFLCSIVVAAFTPSAVQRIRLIVREKNPLSIFGPTDSAEDRKANSDYCKEVLSGAVRSKLRRIQSLVPAGEPLGAWVMAPFWFDFTRNQVFHAEPAGLTMRWAQLPPATKYFLLEYSSFAVRTGKSYGHQLGSDGYSERLAAACTLAFLSSLEEQSLKSEILYYDETYILMRMKEPLPHLY